MKFIKKLVFAVALIGGITTMNAQFSIGGGVGFNDKMGGPGILAKAEVEIMDNISISPSISYFFGSKLYGYERNLFAVDANGHYKIEIMMDELDVYPLAGLNYSSYNTGDYRLNDDEFKVKGNSLGLNIGGGGRWKFTDQLSVFAELKYVISNYSQVVFAGGILYEL
ncbi:porin family protein [Aureibaculum sp. 2210JD6-5]|uniref:outer membrane protein n=1 Tax=Aureibaculum sp. 2210JD6-5 TaxID=3103957 RepID=UPI002AACDC38|nr:outer membrane beta-barrel protein [Aureibaculum sp. 2210JD6-5]MDY7394743.1 porin family protein [Aureibaculum sp. 2210JD6-5]